MDELKPDNQSQGQSDLRPDTSDRPTGRPRQPATKAPKSKMSLPRIAISRQHIMIGIGVLVLLLLIIAISSALKAPTDYEKQQTPETPERNIDLSNSSSLSSGTNQGQSQEISMPPINGTPVQNQLPSGSQNSGERVEIPGDVVDALNQGQGLPPISPQQTQTLPPQMNQPVTPVVTPPVEQPKTTTAVKPIKVEPKPVKVDSKPKVVPVTKPAVKANSAQSGNVAAAPASNYTLQLSSASRPDTLETFAKQNNLSGYQVYKTVRNGQTWYVLIHGNYRSVNDAKSAIATLPADVQAKKPWVRNMKQVKQDQK